MKTGLLNKFYHKPVFKILLQKIKKDFIPIKEVSTQIN